MSERAANERSSAQARTCLTATRGAPPIPFRFVRPLPVGDPVVVGNSSAFPTRRRLAWERVNDVARGRAATHSTKSQVNRGPRPFLYRRVEASFLVFVILHHGHLPILPPRGKGYVNHYFASNQVQVCSGVILITCGSLAFPIEPTLMFTFIALCLLLTAFHSYI